MLYFDYNWDLGTEYIVPDAELNTDRLEWKAGDLWEMIEVDGKLRLHKVDPLIKFIVNGVRDKQLDLYYTAVTKTNKDSN
jgi:hypothetical protein